MNPTLNFDQLAKTAKRQSLKLASLNHAQRNGLLHAIKEQVQQQKTAILEANQKDQQLAAQLNPALLNRLKLDEFKTEQLATYLDTVAALKDPLGEIQLKTKLDQGLVLKRISCPIGVLAVIFESRPEVVIQVSALALKSGNAVLLKGGSEATHTNKKLFEILNQALAEQHLAGAVQLLENRAAVQSILDQEDCIDLIIPRGSNQLVRSIQDNTNITVLGHSEGICHLYIDSSANPTMAQALILDSKLDYPAACNAVETLLVHADIASTVLPDTCKQLIEAGVELVADAPTCELARQANLQLALADEQEWATEYTDLKLSIKQVQSTQEAVGHINQFGSGHTDAIVTENALNKNYFLQHVNSACVFHNASTRFSDGFVFGLGAEVGISTHKIHARGPVGLEGLLTYKYQLCGAGQIKADYAGPNARPFLHEPLQ